VGQLPAVGALVDDLVPTPVGQLPAVGDLVPAPVGQVPAVGLLGEGTLAPNITLAPLDLSSTPPGPSVDRAFSGGAPAGGAVGVPRLIGSAQSATAGMGAPVGTPAIAVGPAGTTAPAAPALAGSGAPSAPAAATAGSRPAAVPIPVALEAWGSGAVAAPQATDPAAGAAPSGAPAPVAPQRPDGAFGLGGAGSAPQAPAGGLIAVLASIVLICAAGLSRRLLLLPPGRGPAGFIALHERPG